MKVPDDAADKPAGLTPDEGAESRPVARTKILVWMCVLIGVSQVGFGAIVPVLPLYAGSFGVSAFAIGLTIAVFGLARFLLTVPTGYLADRLGRRYTLAIGGIVGMLGNAWCAIAQSYLEFVLARFVAGAGSAIVLTAGVIVLADISRPDTRGRTMAWYQATFVFAVGVGPLPGGLLAQWYGLAAPFVAYGLMSVIVGAVAWFAVPETRTLQFAGKQSQKLPPLSAQLRILTESTAFLLVGLINLVSAFVRTGAIFNVVPVLATIKIQLSPGEIGGALALGSLLGLLASYPGGFLADRFGRKAVILPSMALKVVALALFALAGSFNGFLVACLLWGISISLAASGPAAYAADLAPRGMNAAAMSGYRLLGEMGYIIGPVLLGLMVDWSGPESVLWFCALLILLVGGVFAIVAPETHPRRDRQI